MNKLEPSSILDDFTFFSIIIYKYLLNSFHLREVESPNEQRNKGYVGACVVCEKEGTLGSPIVTVYR